MTASTSTAPASLTALLSYVIDYAGLFPPARLDMATTVRNYAQFLDHPDGWMLERLIVPVARLDEFEAAAKDLLPRGEEDDPWSISAITAPAGAEELVRELEAIAAFNERHMAPTSGQAVIDVIETKASDVAGIESVLDVISDELFPFFEIDPRGDVRGLIAAMAGDEGGAKIRTGGVTPDLSPSPAHLATFIATCAAGGVPFKATAGLHHPLRHHVDALGVDEFGFLNVFVAAAFALHHECDEAEVLPMLEAGSIDAFSFDDEGLAFGDERLTVEEIEDARLTFAVSFGSCSFNEPGEHLRGLGLLT